MGSQEDFFGGYDYKAQAGIVHIANHHISPGKKQWTWGNHEFGYAWDRNLTDADARGEYAPYIEIMAGVYTDNQPDFSFLQPGETKSWSQYWYPIQKIGPAQHANLDAAVSLNVEERRTAARRCGYTQSAATKSLSIAAKGKEALRGLSAIFRRPCRSLKKSSCRKSIVETDLLVRVSDNDGQRNDFLSAKAARERRSAAARHRAAGAGEKSRAPTNCTSPACIWSNIATPRVRPTLYWREALRRDPLDARCNNALGLVASQAR